MGMFRGVELDDVELTGDRLTLRRWRAEDAARVLEVMQDRSMSTYLALPEPYTAETAHTYVTATGHEGRGMGLGVGSAIVETATGRVVGSAALRFVGQPDVGYWIAPDARGHGYAAEACRLLADFGFGLGLHRIQLTCDVTNLASVHTAMSAGFRFEATFRDAGVGGRPPLPVDLACFSRLPGEAGNPVPPMFVAMPERSDGVVALRVMAPEDAGGFRECEDELTQSTGFGQTRPTPREYQRVTARAGLDCLVGNRAMLTIVDVATGRMAGSVTVRKNGPPNIGGIGYVVHPDFRGRGYTTRALRLLVPWAFEHDGIARLELGAKVGNVASQRAALAAGFQPDGVMANRLRAPDGTYHDEARFFLVNPALSGATRT